MYSCELTSQTFSELESTEDVYAYSIQPLVPLLFAQGTITCFAYGQTGSGKTYTMLGVQKATITDLFRFGKEKFG